MENIETKMGKSFKRSRDDFNENESYETDKRRMKAMKDRRKQKRMKNALKSKDIDFLLEDEDDAYL